MNCAALPEALLESELFGHVRGAFTGANTARPGLFVEADGGTLFLDEIGDMQPALQAKLLHAIASSTIRPIGASKERAVDVRVVTATNRNLRKLVEAGTVIPMREMQRRYAAWALERFSGRKMITCDKLEIDPKTLARWLASDEE